MRSFTLRTRWNSSQHKLDSFVVSNMSMTITEIVIRYGPLYLSQLLTPYMSRRSR